MKIGTCKPVLAAILCLAVSSIVRADTYVAFETKRFFSANAHYFVEVRPDKRATLYRMEPREQIWSRVLPELPSRLFISNDGTRVIMVDHYYGNGGKSSAKVVVFLDEAGKQIAAHELGDVAALSRVLHTISSAHWYYGALFSADQATFIVETVAHRCEAPNTPAKTPEAIAAVHECMKSDPHEELRFSMSNGALVSRADISRKYADREKQLLHRLELILEEHPPNDLSLGYVVSELASFYEEQKNYSRAEYFYEQAIQVYSRKLGATSDFAAKARAGQARVRSSINPN